MHLTKSSIFKRCSSIQWLVCKLFTTQGKAAMQLSNWKILLGMLTIIALGCNPTSTPAPAEQVTQTPSASLAAIDLLRLGHERMGSVESYRAHLDVEIVNGEEHTNYGLSEKRAPGGPSSIILTSDPPGAAHREEIILQDGHFYLKDENEKWVEHQLVDRQDSGTYSSRAVELASRLDFFGNLLPNSEVLWQIYDVKSLGTESLEGLQVQHLQVLTDFQEMSRQVEESRRDQFIGSKILGTAPEELFQQTETSKMELWIDERGYVRQMSIMMVLTGGRSLKLRMRGYDFDKNITVRVPTDKEESLREFSVVPSSMESSTATDSESSGEPEITSPVLQDGSITPDTTAAATPVPPSPPSSITSTVAQVMTRDEVRSSLALGISLNRRNLSGADLSHAHLAGANFQDANLTDANLYAADLSQADLRGANLIGADLTRADLRLADMRRTNLTNVDLSRLDVEAANLSDIQLAGADLNRSYMARTTLTEANLEGAKLNRVYLGEANLTRANLRDADLTDAYLRDADLTGADLTGANLSGAILIDAKLNGTILFGADLRGADLSGATLISVELRVAELGGSDFADEGSTPVDLGSESKHSSGGSAIIEGTFFDKNTAWNRAFCGEVFRCTREMLLKRGALLGG